jgi:hypothetical protein
MSSSAMNCESLQRAMIEERRELTMDEAAHLAACDECMEVMLTVSLEEKPIVAVPADFAARVVAGLPARQTKRAAIRTPRPWGFMTAMAIATVLLVVCFAGSPPVNTWVGLVFVLLVASEIAGLALWLGPRWTGR